MSWIRIISPKFEYIHDKALKRSIYANGSREETATIEINIEKMFEPSGPINAARLRRNMENPFKISLIVKFSNEEAQQKFMSLDEKLIWNNTESTIRLTTSRVESEDPGIPVSEI
ncbi:hypothetical protein RUND412_005770 [Rhizina undulata]